MALQIRRGTAQELSTFTPAEGELIFDKTNGKVYVGDGQTVGGLDVSIAGGIGGPLSAGINLNTYSITGVGDINITGSIAVSGTIAGDFEGALQGNVIGSLAGDVYGNLVGGSVLGSDSSVLVDSITNKITGDLTGNIVGISDNIVLDNSLQNPVFYGTVSGSVIGDVYGSVIGADSTVIVDTAGIGINTSDLRLYDNVIQSIVPGSIEELDGEIKIGTPAEFSRFLINAGNDVAITARGFLSLGIQPYIAFEVSNTSITNPDSLTTGDEIGSVVFRGWNGLDYQNICGIRTEVTNISGSGLEGTIKLTVITSSGPADAKLRHDKVFQIPGALKCTPYDNDGDRDAALPTPEAGMIIFNLKDDSAGTPRFQGYDGTSWVDLH
jgi:hypothetical protein